MKIHKQSKYKNALIKKSFTKFKNHVKENKTLEKVKQVVTKTSSVAKVVASAPKLVNSAANIVQGNQNNVVLRTVGKSNIVKTKKIIHKVTCPKEDFMEDTLDTLQKVLDWIGWISGVGDVFDAINAVISYCRGNYLECFISAACLALPLVADAILKPIKKTVRTAAEFAQKAVEKLSQSGHSVSKIISSISGFFGKAKNFVKSCIHIHISQFYNDTSPH